MGAYRGDGVEEIQWARGARCEHWHACVSWPRAETVKRACCMLPFPPAATPPPPTKPPPQHQSPGGRRRGLSQRLRIPAHNGMALRAPAHWLRLRAPAADRPDESSAFHPLLHIIPYRPTTADPTKMNPLPACRIHSSPSDSPPDEM